MSGDEAILRSRPAAFLVAAILLLLPLAPPDVLGQACAAVAALVALAALTSFRAVSPVRAGFFACAVALAIPLARAAAAPGPAVRPLAGLLVCVAAGLAAAALPPPVRSLAFWSGAIAAAGAWVGGRAVWEATFGLEAMRAALSASAAIADRELVLGRLAEGRAYAGFPTPAALGAFLVLALAVTVGSALVRSGRGRALLGAAAVLEAAGLVASRSLSAAGALVAALVLLALASGPAGHARRRLAGALVLAIALLGTSIALRGRGAFDAGVEDGPWSLRLGNVRAAIAMAVENPWLGVGPGGFGESFPRYRRPSDNTTRHAHSLPFDLAAETGLPLAALLTALFFAVFLAPLFRARADAAASGAALGLAAFALQNLADFTALLPSTLGVAAIVRGLAARPLDPARERERGGRVAGPMFAVAALGACALFGLDGLAAEARREAKAWFAAGASASALEAAERACAWAPWDADARLYRAQILAASGRPEAVDAVEAAIDRVPERPVALALRAQLRAGRGDLGGALADFERAASLYPVNPEYARARDEFARRLAGVLP